MNKKISYTWYPKDWTNSDTIFELTLTERGLYRELIDKAMLTDNKTIFKSSVWSRKFNIELIELEKLLQQLIIKQLIEVKDNILFIPSCEPRLNLCRGGSKGGSKSKPTHKPMPKPTPKQSKVKESKVKESILIPTFLEFKIYAISKSDLIDNRLLKLKYESWNINGWKDGNNKPIKNWKSKLLNTIPYLEKVKQYKTDAL